MSMKTDIQSVGINISSEWKVILFVCVITENNNASATKGENNRHNFYPVVFMGFVCLVFFSERSSGFLFNLRLLFSWN